jgi:hypothetical protein
MIRMKGDHHAGTPSCFAVADRRPYPNAVQLRERFCEVTKALELGTYKEIPRGFWLLNRRSRTTRAAVTNSAAGSTTRRSSATRPARMMVGVLWALVHPFLRKWALLVEYKRAKAGTSRTLEVKSRTASRLGLASPVAAPVAAVHSGQGHRAQRAAQRVDKQGDRPGFGRHGALEHLNGVAERTTRHHRIPQHHDRV